MKFINFFSLFSQNSFRLASCEPSPCGPNSQCKSMDGKAECTCEPGNIGEPPSCRPECRLSYDCSENEACYNKTCIDPCPGSCGFNAKCEVKKHNPFCSCPPKHSGNPFINCEEEETQPDADDPALTPSKE